MPNTWIKSYPSQQNRSLDILRITTALITVVHPIHRIINGNVRDFGDYLNGEGFPAGVALAWLISLLQIAGSVSLLVKRWIVPLCTVNIFIFLVGIIIDHAKSGWFVVGGGNNGVEYSVLLIACELSVLWAYWPRKQ